MEVVIAITIFAICISLVYGLYSSITSVVERVEEQTARDESAKTILDRLTMDLKGMYTGRQGLFVGLESGGIQGEDPLLTLVSTAHLSLKNDEIPIDVALIRYYLVEEDGDISTLLRSDTPIKGDRDGGTTEDGPKHRLGRNLSVFELTYLGAEGIESETWDSRLVEDDGNNDEERFPTAVHVKIAFAENDNTQESRAVYELSVSFPPDVLEFEGEQ